MLLAALLVAVAPAQVESPTPVAHDRARVAADAMQLRPGMVVADIGCGTGWIAVAVAEQVGPTGRVYAVDISFKAIEAVRKKGVSEIVPVLSVPNDILLPEDSLDLAFMFDSASHIKADVRPGFYASIARALKPGAALMIFKHHGGGAELLTDLRGHGFVLEDPTLLDGLDTYELDKRLRAGVRFLPVPETRGAVVPRSLVERTWVVDGVERTALVAVPPPIGPASPADPFAPAPLVFVFHGHYGNAEQMARKGFHDRWPEAVLVYPQGLRTATPYDREGNGAGWQHRLGDHDDRDLVFFDAMLASLREEWSIDARRIYATGHSNGGVFTYLLWEARGEVFAALAPSASGPTGMRGSEPTWPRLPVMQLAGREDELVKFRNQRLLTALLRIYNDCDPSGLPWPAPAGVVATLYSSPHDAPLVTWVHPGGHEFTDDAAAAIVRFLRQHAKPPPPNRYNVLFLAIDDLRPELGSYGVEYVRTPHIDALAAEGVTFLNHFVEVPTCGASRYAMLTGRSAAASGVRGGNDAFHRGASALDAELLDGAQSLPELFRRSGYHTTLIGKLSHTPDGKVYAYDGSGDGRPEMPHAWDEFATPYGNWLRGWGSFFGYADGAHREDGQGHRDLMEFLAVSEGELPDGMMADEAIERIKAFAKTDERFFLGVGFYKPHLPFVATGGDWDAVQDWPVPAPSHPETISSQYATRSGEFYGYDVPWEKTRPLEAASAHVSRLAYLACVRHVDRQVGRVLAALEKNGLADNTIVVLWSDHGWFLGEGGMWGKHTPLEQALRSPLILRVPDTSAPGTRVDALVSSLDVYPTLLELCRPAFSETQHPLDGVSLVPLFASAQATVRNHVVSTWNEVISVRSSGFRLIISRDGEGWDSEELYDLRSGSLWHRDVAAERPGLVAALRALVD